MVCIHHCFNWIPAFAGMTSKSFKPKTRWQCGAAYYRLTVIPAMVRENFNTVIPAMDWPGSRARDGKDYQEQGWNYSQTRDVSQLDSGLRRNDEQKQFRTV